MEYSILETRDFTLVVQIWLDYNVQRESSQLSNFKKVVKGLILGHILLPMQHKLWNLNILFWN